MNAARAAEDLGTGTEQQMISVREQNLRARILKCLGKLRLHGGLRPHRHEKRRPHFVVQSSKRRSPRAGARRLRVEAEVQSRAIHTQRFTRKLVNCIAGCVRSYLPSNFTRALC